MQWIITNIVWVKDTFTVIFLILATVISIKTYIKAKKTILQPLRTEVVKRQADLLSTLIKDLGINSGELLFKIDYHGIAELNILKYLSEMGCEYRSHEKILEYVKKHTAGSLIVCGDTDELKEINVVIGLEKEGDVFEPDDKQEKAYKGNFKLELLYITPIYQDFLMNLNNYINSPFIPQKIQEELGQLRKDVEYNLHVVMKQSFEELINKMFLNMKEGKFDEWLKPAGLINHFLIKSKDHKNYSIKIISLIREFLKIDDDW